MNDIVPSAPHESCLTREDFLGPDFSPDAILTRQPNLERLRQDLGLYLKILRSAVLQLIDEDYSDFLELSSHLLGLDAKLQSLTQPLNTLSDKLSALLESLRGTREAVLSALRRKEDIRAQKSGLRNSERILNALSKLELILSSGSPLSGDAEERLARDINHLHFRISKCHDDKFVSHELTPRLSAIGDRLRESLESRFMSSIKTGSEVELKRCLRIYATIESIHEAESLVKTTIVSPRLEAILNEEAFNDEPLGLKGVYLSVLKSIPETLEPLLQLTTSRGKPVVIRGFSFLIHSFWEEFVEKMEEDMSFVFAAGNPEAFLSHYRLSLEFIRDFEAELQDPEQVAAFRSAPSYASFMGRWNLPVYFQIRFQEIALPLETALNSFFEPSTGDNYHLRVFDVISQSLRRVWNPEIFIQALLHRSLKLTLQILSRSGTALTEVLQDEEQSGGLKTLVHLWTDVSTFCKDFEPFIYTPHILPLLKENVGDENLLRRVFDSLKESLDSLGLHLGDISAMAIARVTEESLKSLRQVSDIPRLYRRTNRDVPNRHCPYVDKILDPLTRFREDGASERTWTVAILSQVSQEYLSKVSEVLEAVFKMEESLKRLKRIREKSDVAAGAPGGGAAPLPPAKISDNDKIRLQIKVDVEYFSSQVLHCFGIESPQEVACLEDLLRVVREATKEISGSS